MRFRIKAGSGKKEIDKIKKKLSSGAGFDAHKFNGVLKIKGDALAIQKKLHNEWERTAG